MRIKIFILLTFLLSFRAIGQTVTGASIETNGYVMDVFVSLANGTNGSFNFFYNSLTNRGPGWTNAVLYPTASTPAFSLTSLGYDDNGNQTTLTRNLLLNRQLRMPYPAVLTNDVTPSGSGVMCRVAMSDYVYSTDSNVLLTLPASWYSNNTAIANLAVTNSSSLTSFVAIANWSMPAGQRITNSTMPLSVVAFHESAQSGRSVRMVQFIAHDQHSHAVTNNVTQPASTRCGLTTNFVSEYVANMDISTFSNLDLIRCDFTVYPWRSDTNGILSTLDNKNKFPTGLYCGVTNLCDRLMAWGNVVAIVDSTNGSDSTGVVSTNGSLNVLPFLTINGAAVAMAVTNKLFNHNDCSGGTFYLTNGTHVFTSASGSYGASNGVSSCTIMAHPASPIASVLIGSASGNKKIGLGLNIFNLTINSTTVITFSGLNQTYTSNCIINATADPIYYINGVNWMVDSVITNMPDGLRFYGAVNAEYMVRGTILALTNSGTFAIGAKVFIGNLASANGINNISYNPFVSGQTAPLPLGLIIAYNALYCLSNSSANDFTLYFSDTNATAGCVIANNIIESIPSNKAIPIITISADSTTNIVRNILVWNNVFVGQRCNMDYQEFGTTFIDKFGFFINNNIFAALAIKSDDYLNNGGGSGNRLGNWPEFYGCGISGNLNENGPYSANFLPIYPGFAYDVPAPSGSPPSGTARTPPYINFVSDKSWPGSGGAGTGGGNYRLQSWSPGILLNAQSVKLPFDIAGQPRGAYDPPGAYANTPKLGNGFFGQ